MCRSWIVRMFTRLFSDNVYYLTYENFWRVTIFTSWFVRMFTAHSRKDEPFTWLISKEAWNFDETRNGRRNGFWNPRWSSQVSFRMAHLKRDLNFAISFQVAHLKRDMNFTWNPRWSSQVSFRMAHLKRDLNFDHRGFRFPSQWGFRDHFERHWDIETLRHWDIETLRHLDL